MEKETGLTRGCLRILARSDCQIQLITKGTVVARDTDILKQASATVSMTITMDNEDTARLLEPNAPTPSERLKTVETLAEKDVAISVRIDPIIPFVNENQEELIAALASLGVKHITASTYKPRKRDWQRFVAVMPEVAERVKPLYQKFGERVHGCVLLPRDLRLSLLSSVRRLVLQNGMQFAVCREGLSELNTAACDGSWLLLKTVR